MAEWVGRAQVDVVAEYGVWLFCFIVSSEACRHTLHYILACHYSVRDCIRESELGECGLFKNV